MYTGTTDSSTATITAVAEQTEDTIVIKNGETTVENEGTATWSEGANTLTVTVTDGYDSTKSATYTATITYTAPEGDGE